jgi:arsenate reductase (thioredoxin)
MRPGWTCGVRVRISETEMKKVKVLFLCTGNSARSQMAEAFLREYAGDRFEVFSAGLEPQGINPFARKVMEEIGLDLSGQHSKGVRQFLGHGHFGYVITVCAQAESQCPIFPGASIRLHWPFEDPAAFQGTEEQKLNKFREIRDQIHVRIESWLRELS